MHGLEVQNRALAENIAGKLTVKQWQRKEQCWGQQQEMKLALKILETKAR